MFEEIVARYRLYALYDNDDNCEYFSNSSDSESTNSIESYPGCSSKKACHIAILIKGLQGYKYC